jgi:hypothetical protein
MTCEADAVKRATGVEYQIQGLKLQHSLECVYSGFVWVCTPQCPMVRVRDTNDRRGIEKHVTKEINEEELPGHSISIPRDQLPPPPEGDEWVAGFFREPKSEITYQRWLLRSATAFTEVKLDGKPVDPYQ